MPRILFCGGNENAVDHWHPDPGAYGLDGRDYTLIPAPVSIQRELDRAKPLRKPKESLLCVFATLRETGFPWLLKDLVVTQVTKPNLLRFYSAYLSVQSELDRAKAQSR